MADRIDKIAAISNIQALQELALVAMLVEDIRNIEGILRKPSGQALKITILTLDKMVENYGLAKVQECAQQGLLGSVGKDGVEFRSDVAAKIRNATGTEKQSFVDTSSDQVFEAQVNDLSHDTYAKLQQIIEILTTINSQNEVKEHEDKNRKATPHAAPHLQSQFGHKPAPKVTPTANASRSKAGDNYTQQQKMAQDFANANQENFNKAMKKLEKAKEKDREYLKEAIKKEDAKKEITQADLKKTDRRRTEG